MSAAEVGSYVLSGIVGALVTAALFAVALGGRVIKVETRLEGIVGGLDKRMDSLEKNLTAIFTGLGLLLREDIIDRARRERYDDETRHNR